jgi:branched-chain amino acid transport system permease protein
MVDSFGERTLINPFLNMGYLVLFASTTAIAYLAARGEVNVLEEPDYPISRTSLDGLITGLIAGLATSAFVMIVDSVDLTRFFPNFGPGLIEAMTFGLELVPGLIVLIAVSGVVGALGGSVLSWNEEVRRRSTWAVLTVFSFALFEVVVTDILDFSRSLARLIYAPLGGLEWYVALVIGALAYWLSGRYKGRSKQTIETIKAAERWSRVRWSVYAFAGIALLLPWLVLGGIVNELLTNVALYVLLGLGLNIVVGYAGLLDLGYVAFFAVGAYGTAVLTSPLSPTVSPQLSWWVALPIVVALAALSGLLVGTPVIRMRGDYLAIVTLGFGEIVRILLLSDWLTPLFGGSQGIRQIPGIPFGPWEISSVDPQFFVYFAGFFALLAAYISYRAQNSRVGRSWAAMREDEDVAEAIGVSTVKAKLLAFVTGAIVASFAGALFSAKVGAVFTNSFDVVVSIIILVVVIVGGMGSIPGVAVGAFVLIGVLGGPKSNGLLQEFAEYKLLIYGAILIYMMLKRPEGLIPSVRRSRELHHEESLQDAWLDKAGEFTGDDTAEATT